jgi:hypothetical protein
MRPLVGKYGRQLQLHIFCIEKNLVKRAFNIRIFSDVKFLHYNEVPLPQASSYIFARNLSSSAFVNTLSKCGTQFK